MAWTPRTLAELSARARGAFREWLPGTDTALANNFVTVVTKVMAALAFEFELRMVWLTKQMFLRTATGVWLEQHCADIGIYRKRAAAASGSITGTGAESTTYPVGIRFVSGNQTYKTTAPATSDGDGNITFAVLSEIKGSQANRDADGVMTLADPALYPGLAQQFSVGAGGIGGGADIEDIESLRSRGLQRKQNPPGGGSLTDYERVARGVPGVIAAWAYRRATSPGMVSVLFLFEGRANSIPLSSDVDAVQAAIDATRLIRVDDSVAAAPIARPIDITINGLSLDTDDVRSAISASIDAMFLARCRPGLTGDTFTVSKSWIAEAISTATGEERHVLAAPPGDIVLTGGQWPVRGVMSYGA